MPLSYALLSFFGSDTNHVKRGEMAVKSNHIIKFTFDGTVNIIRSTVHASMKNRAYEVQLWLNEDGDLVTSHACTCPRGKEKCHHMAAALIHAIETVSCTDQVCVWKKPKQAASTISLDTLFEAKYFSPLLCTPTPDDAQWLVTQLSAVGKFTGAAWILSSVPETDSACTVKMFDNVVSDAASLGVSTDVEYFLAEMAVTEESITEVEMHTRGQRLNPLWGKFRKGRITASNFGLVIKACARKKFPPSLFKTLLGNYNLTGVQAVQWGIDNEQEAINAYEKKMKVKVEAAGLFLHCSGLLAASPDGLVGKDKVIEVKCPYSLRKTNVTGNCSSKFFLHEDQQLGLQLNLKSEIGNKYWHQIQGVLHLTGRNLCDLIVWTPQETAIIPYVKDVSWADNFYVLMQFWYEQFFPELSKKKVALGSNNNIFNVPFHQPL